MRTEDNSVLKNTEEIIKVLKTLKADAEMALADEWDRSDEGFICQINLINNLLLKL